MLPRFPNRSRLLAVIVGAALLGCGKDSSTGPHVGPPANMSIVSGDAQSGVVGEELATPLVVRVVDANGDPVQGQLVNFRVTAGGGSVFAGSSNTNTDGVAQERWTLGTVAGAGQTVEARAVDNATGQALVFATFHANATPDVPAALKILRQPSAATQSGQPLAVQPTVQLIDKYGNAAPRNGVQIVAGLSAHVNEHTISGTSTVATDNTGLATFTNIAVAGPIGAVTLSFTASGLAPATSNSIALAPGAPTQLAAVGPTSASGAAGGPLTTLPRVVARDAAGNVVAGVSITFAVSNNGGTIAPTSVTTDANGEAALGSWTLPKQSGTAIVIASASAIPNVTVTFTVTVSASAATHIVRADDLALIGAVGSSLPVALRVTDDYGNVVSGASVNVVVGVNSGSLSVPGSGSSGASVSVTSDATGTVNLTWTLGALAGQQTLTASLNGTGIALTVTATATAGAAAKLAIVTQPSSNAQSGQPLATPPAVRLTDAYGNAVAQSGVQVTASLANDNGGHTLTGNTATTDANGLATFTSLAIAGPTGLVSLSFGAANLTSVTSGTISIGAGTATQLKAVGSTSFSGTVGTSLTTLPKVVVQDAAGNPVAGVTVQFAVSTGGGMIAPASVATNANGEATLTSWVLPTQPGTAMVVASASAIPNATVSFTANVVAAQATHLVRADNTPLTGAVGTSLPLAFRVTDDYGNAVSGATVSVAVGINSGSVAAPGGSAAPSVSVTSDASGTVNVIWTLGIVAGEQGLTATLSGSGAALNVSATANPGAAAKLAIVTQPSSTAESGQALATQPVVRLDDAYGNSVAQGGIQVTASVTNDDKGRTLSGNIVATDANGLARFSSLTITGAAGTISLTFSAPNIASVASTSVTLNAATQLKAIGPTAFTGTVASALATLPKVVAQDAGGNPVAGILVQFALSSGGGSITPTTAVTDANGYAALTNWTLGTTAGAQTVTATAPAIAGAAVKFTATAQAGPASQLVAVSGNDSSVATGQTITLVSRANDGYGNAVTGATVNWAAQALSSAGGPPTLSASSSVTDASGQASVVLTAPNTVTRVLTNASLPNGVRITFSDTVIALTRTWIGGAPGAESDWSNAANWNPLGIPGLTDAIVIPVTNYQPHGDATVTNVTIAPGTQVVGGLTFACCWLGRLSGTVTGAVVSQSTVNLTGPTAVGSLVKYYNSGFDLQGQPLVVNGDLTEQGYGTLQGGGTILVYGNTTLTNALQVESLQAKGDVSLLCISSPCVASEIGAPLTLSGTAHQTLSVADPHYQSLATVTATSGTDVTLTANTTSYTLNVGTLDLSGTFTIPAGVTVYATSIKLHSGSTTTVLGTLTSGSCTKDASGVTYSGFVCQ